MPKTLVDLLWLWGDNLFWLAVIFIFFFRPWGSK